MDEMTRTYLEELVKVYEMQTETCASEYWREIWRHKTETVKWILGKLEHAEKRKEKM